VRQSVTEVWKEKCPVLEVVGGRRSAKSCLSPADPLGYGSAQQPFPTAQLDRLSVFALLSLFQALIENPMNSAVGFAFATFQAKFRMIFWSLSVLAALTLSCAGQEVTTVATFNGVTGSSPVFGPVQGIDGNFYGTLAGNATFRVRP
jgi:hypothetical protein